MVRVVRLFGVTLQIQQDTNRPQRDLPCQETPSVETGSSTRHLGQAKKQLKSKDDACLAEKLDEFLTSSSRSRSRSRSRNASPRFSFNLSYSERARYEFQLPTTNFAFHNESASS